MHVHASRGHSATSINAADPSGCRHWGSCAALARYREAREDGKHDAQDGDHVVIFGTLFKEGSIPHRRPERETPKAVNPIGKNDATYTLVAIQVFLQVNLSSVREESFNSDYIVLVVTEGTAISTALDTGTT